MLQYFQFPKFLLKLRISQTAKFLYMILYDRARISRKNSWIDKYGNVAPSKENEKYKRNKYNEVNYCYGEGESL